MQIEIYADVVCPWCYIGERRLEKALAQRPDLAVELHWRPFQLQPQMPASGLPWAEFAQKKFGGLQRAQAAFAQVTATGATDGIEFNFDQVVSAPNTVDSHRLILFAAQQGRQWEVVDKLFAAYFALGFDLNDTEQLIKVAVEAGLDAEATRLFLAGDQYRAEVLASQETAESYGIHSVPSFILEGRYLLTGAQPLEIFLKALDMAAA